MADEVWKHGSMRFTNLHNKPTDISVQCWLDAKEKGRTWVSKKGECPSSFLARIIKDMEDDGADIYSYLREEMEYKPFEDVMSV